MRIGKVVVSVLALIGLKQHLYGALTYHREAFQSLLKKGDTETLVNLGPILPTLNFIMPDGDTPLTYAVKRGNKKLVCSFLKAGANPNYRDISQSAPLYHAIRRRNKALVMILLEAGADPNASADGNQFPTCLCVAANYPEIFSILLDAGGDVNKPGYGFYATGLMHAVWWDAVNVVRHFLYAGADINIKNSKGNTAVILARSDKIKRILVDRGAEYTEFRERDKARAAHHYYHRGQVIQSILEDERDLPRDLSRLVCEFAAVPKGQRPGKLEYKDGKPDRTCWGMLKRMCQYVVPLAKEETW